MLLPPELRVRDDLLQRAGQWLHAHLRDADPQFVRDNFCPCTHGAIVLELLNNPSGGKAVADRSHQVVTICP